MDDELTLDDDQIETLAGDGSEVETGDVDADDADGTEGDSDESDADTDTTDAA